METFIVRLWVAREAQESQGTLRVVVEQVATGAATAFVGEEGLSLEACRRNSSA